MSIQPPATELYYVISWTEAGRPFTLHYRDREKAQARARQLRDVEHRERVRLRARRYRTGAVQVIEDA